MAEFGADTTGEFVVEKFADQVRGRTFLINGVSPGGIGDKIATLLANGGPAGLILIGNPEEASGLESSVAEMKASNLSAHITLHLMKTSSFKNLRHVAQNVLADTNVAKIDVMFNIQTELPRANSQTEDGLEYILQANYLSSFLLTNLVLSKIIEAQEPRVINLSSSANKVSGINWDDPNYLEAGAPYQPWTAYGQAKTAAILFTTALNDTFSSRKTPSSASSPQVQSYSLHPGGVKTKLQEQLTEEDLAKAFEATKQRFGEEKAKDFFTFKTLSTASATPLRAALDPTLPGLDGAWLDDCQLRVESRHLDPRATDVESARRLWKMSEEMVNEVFEW